MATTKMSQKKRRTRRNDARQWLYGLYAITPDDARYCADTLALQTQVEQAIAGGACVIQYRNKSLQYTQKLAQAETIKSICRANQVCFIINDDLELAQATDADGIHLGKDDSDLGGARRRLGEKAIIGISCYNRLDLALAAQAQGADYVAFGRFFPSQTKPDAVQADPDLLREAKAQLRIPIAAIGGITAENAQPLIDAGADMLAVIHSIFGDENVIQSASRLAACFDRNLPDGPSTARPG